MAFNLADHLKNVSNLDTGAERIEQIPLELLEQDSKNFYELSDIEGLASNIALVGLLDPIRVREYPEKSGHYVIVSGHRRRAALEKLLSEGDDRFASASCIVDTSGASEAMQELRLIFANSDTRKMSSADLSKQAERVEMLLYELKEQGIEFPGRMRDHVAEACKLSASKLARLKVIREKLQGRWASAYEKGMLAEATAYALAKLSPEDQKDIGDGLMARKGRVEWFREHDVKNYVRGLDQIREIECNHSPYSGCVHEETMRKKVCKGDSWRSDCRGCCSECANLATCRDSCPYLREKVKEIKAFKREENEKARKEKQATEAPVIKRILAFWSRFKGLADGANLSEDQSLELLGRYHYRDTPINSAHKPSIYDRLPYSYSLQLEAIDSINASCEAFGVTSDYLLMRTDDRRPASPSCGDYWRKPDELPEKSSEVQAIILFNGNVSRKLMRLSRDGSFEIFGAPVDPTIMRVLAWMPLPEEPAWVDEILEEIENAHTDFIEDD